MIKPFVQWVDPPAVQVPVDLRNAVHGSDLFLEALSLRGINDPKMLPGFLDYHHYSPASPVELPDMQKAVNRVAAAIKSQEEILVWGDFDVDGQTATAVLISGLRSLGANVKFHVPIRSNESHGVKLEALQKNLARNTGLVITCDTGITANDSAAYLYDQKIDLIITDHHTLPPTLPQAHAVINPHFLPEDHPLSSLAGVGVAYQLVNALFQEFDTASESASLHDLVALGTVADLALLRADNRFLVQSGLERIRRSPRPAIEQMAETAKFVLDQVSEEQISFIIAPRMNAIGRLDDANPMVDFLLSNNPVEIAIILNRLEALNAQRKLLVNQVVNGCLARLDREPTLLDHSLIILDHPEWPGGVVGIAASHLVQIFYKPVILLNSSDPTRARGSARSIEGVDITAALSANRELLDGYGGHAMAAGLALDPANLDAFRRGMDKSIAEMAQTTQITPTLQIDAYQDLNKISPELINDLNRLAPFGPGNPPFIFAARNLMLQSTTEIGRNADHLQLVVEDADGQDYRLLWWQGAGSPLPEGSFDLAYSAHLNNYRGETQLQLEWKDFRPAQEIILITSPYKKQALQLFDQRPETKLDMLSELPPGTQVFREGKTAAKIPGVNRKLLTHSQSLALVTIPPSQEILHEIIKKVNPGQVYVFGFEEHERDLRNFLISFAAWMKQTTTDPGSKINLEEISARFSITNQLSKVSLLWYSLKSGQFLAETEPGVFTLDPSLKPGEISLGKLQTQIEYLFEEMAAYERHYLSAPVDSLVFIKEK